MMKAKTDYSFGTEVTMLNKLNISPQRQILIVYVVLVIVTLAVFWQVNQYGFINFDDTGYVTENSHIQSGISLDGFRWAFSTKYADLWNPLVWLSFMFDYQLHGLNPGGYHLTNRYPACNERSVTFLAFQPHDRSDLAQRFCRGSFCVAPASCGIGRLDSRA